MPLAASSTTCWRRLNEWERENVWLTLWRAFIAHLDQQGQIDWIKSFMDGTFAPAKKLIIDQISPAAWPRPCAQP